MLATIILSFTCTYTNCNIIPVHGSKLSVQVFEINIEIQYSGKFSLVQTFVLSLLCLVSSPEEIFVLLIVIPSSYNIMLRPHVYSTHI